MTATHAAVALWLTCVGLAAAILGIGVHTGFAREDSSFEATVSAGLLVFPTCGGLIAMRRPGNPIGWLFCLVGISWLTMFLAYAYASLALVQEPAVPGGEYAVWVSEWVWIAAIGIPITYPLLLFPDGRLLSPRWRVVAWAAGIAIVASLVFSMFKPGPMEELARSDAGIGFIANPLGVELSYMADVAEAVVTIAFVTLAVSALAAAWSLVLRFRRSSGTERQQLKWFAYAAGMLALAFLIQVIGFSVSEEDIAGIRVPDETVEALGALSLAALFGLPVAAAIAILRYRLYQIDRIISRTLVYGLLTVMLALTYFGLVVSLQSALRPLSGDNDIAIAITTLVVAALFMPLRRRIQDSVDRRFNRRAYNAVRTVDAFSTRLRDQIDLDTLRYELMAVVDETMQPSRASIWLRRAE